MSFTFGAPSATTGNLFAPGASTNPSTTTTTSTSFSFGNTPSTTTPTPSFGAPAGASPFGAPSATTASPFGAPSATTTGASPFGATTATPSFGAPSATTTGASPFGATTSTPFGATNPTTSNPFGASTTTPNLFGATTPSTTTGASPFGTAPSTGTTNLFGATTPSTTTGTSFGFGPTSTTTTTSNFGFPSATSTFPGAQPQAQMGQMQQTPINGKLTAGQQLQNIMNAYNPNSSDCKFRHMMFNFVGPDAPSYGRPSNVPERLWNQAQESNPDPKRLVPVLATGFTEIKKRVDDQDKATADHQKTIEDLQKFVVALQRKHDLESTIKIDQYKRKHMELMHRILVIMKKVEVLRNRGHGITMEEEHFRNKLQQFYRELNKPSLYKSRLLEIVAKVDMQDNERSQYESYDQLDDQSLESLYTYLTGQTVALSQLVDVVRKDIRDLGIIADGLHDNKHNELVAI